MSDLPKRWPGREARENRERFPVDPDVKWVGFAAQGSLVPPEGHARRCQAVNRQSGLQCKNWAIKGRRFCRFHGGKQPLISMGSKGRYASQVSTALGEKLAKMAEEPDDERLSLAEEVDVARVLTSRALKIYDLAINGRGADGQEASEEIRQAAAQGLNQALEATSRLVERFAKVNTLTSGFITAKQIGFLVAQFNKIIADEIQDEEVRNRIAAKIREIDIPDDPNLDPRVGIAIGV